MKKLHARVTTDGYLLCVATEDDYTGSDRYWPDYYSDEFTEDDVDTLQLAGVPAKLV